MLPAQPAGPGAGGAGGAQTAWYSGPVPIDALLPKERFGTAVGLTLVKSLIVAFVAVVALTMIPVMIIAISAAVIGAAGAGAEIDPSATPRTVVTGEAGADLRLVAVPVTGLILGEDRGQGGSFFGALDVTYGYTVKEELARLADDDRVDGIVLELDTPGGTIFGSKAIADGVAAYREATGNPVMAYVGGMSASGGTYAMAGADAIYADHGTLIGSIGVIFGPFPTYDGVVAVDGGLLGGGVTTEGGIEFEYLTAGRNKDLGNPYREMNAEERAVLQEGIDNAYAEFVDHVAAGRGLSAADIESKLGAMIFGEHQAVANGLIDGVANRDDAYRLAAEQAGLGDGETYVVERVEAPIPGLLDVLVGRAANPGAGAPAGTPGAEGPLDSGLGASHQLCLGTGTLLAYHGDPSQLCRWGR